LVEITILEREHFSPDSSGNPFDFFFKKQKIATDSGKWLQIMPNKNIIFC